MEYFFTPEDLLPPGPGFSLWDGMHLRWLAISAAVTALLCLCYRRGSPRRRARLRIAVGTGILLCEVLKDANLIRFGVFDRWYLPLHLCGLAVFFSFYHCLRPGKTVGNFLYSTCAPGALFALLFPDWTAYPPFAYHSIVAFTVHTLIVAYPLMQVCGGDLRPDARCLPRCFGILVGLAIPVYLFDRIFHANYMFLLYPSPGSPLEWFAGLLGNPGYLLGYLPMMAAVWGLLYLPFLRKKPGKKHP